jgi:hypothetical protein
MHKNTKTHCFGFEFSPSFDGFLMGQGDTNRYSTTVGLLFASLRLVHGEEGAHVRIS